VVDEQKMTVATNLEPVLVTVMGTGSTKPEFLPSGTVAETPGSTQPNLIVRVIRPFVGIAVRFGFTFFGQVAGLLMAAMTPQGSKILYTGDFFELLLTCASLSVPWAMLDLIKNLVTVFKGLENKYPLLTGSV
jgi:hypothetical protein